MSAEEKVKKSWMDTLPSTCRIEVKVDGRLVIKKRGGET